MTENKFEWTTYDKEDAKYLSEKYNVPHDLTPIQIGKELFITTTRKEWYKQKVQKEYGISYINGQNMRHVKGSGSKRKTPPNKGKDSKKRTKFIPPPFELNDIFKVNYNEIYNCEQDIKFNKIYRLEFDHKYYNEWQIDMYEKYQNTYNEGLHNGEIDNINVFFQKLSTYMKINHMCTNKDSYKFVDGSVICNIALMIAKYLKTGIFDTDITWINNMTIEELNETNNTYMLFLILQCFSSKYRWKMMIHDGEVWREWWAINLLRRRDKNKDSRTLGVIPRFERDENGFISYKLY